MKTNIITLILLVPLYLFSQNYQCVYPEITAYFEPEEDFNSLFFYEQKFFRALEPKDTVINSITELTNFNSYKTIDYKTDFLEWDECVYPDMASWIGWKALLFPGGRNIFLNRNMDSIFIETSAMTGDTWEFYKRGDSIIYQAEITDYDTMTFLGINDSVKFIDIYALNQDQSQDFQIIISKNHGFIKTLNFRDFIGFGDTSQTYEVLHHNLVGLSDPAVGFQNLRYGDIFDFEPGDETHWTLSFPYGYESEIRKYLVKEEFGQDSVVYTLHLTKWGFNGQNNDTTYFNDTIAQSYQYPDSLLRAAMPFSSFREDSNWVLSDHTIYRNEPMFHRDVLYVSAPKLNYNGNCFVVPFEYFDIWQFNYIKGIGREHIYQDVMGGFTVYFDLKYYLKGSETWGTPLDPPVNIKEHNETSIFMIYPNPADQYVQIKHKNNIEKIVRIIDLNGKEIFNRITTSNNIGISTSDFKNGVYIIEIKYRQNKQMEKLLISH
ncbi:MAG: T9SS type A sorting domain-containing protein [Bacteroidales bacterium]|nr:T9SS type A sorting domain-containing protein [Bacteroidales bacterium]MCF8398527.1 T9SS type A sorting domain-containing protein [Bacteroidales bacterium]